MKVELTCESCGKRFLRTSCIVHKHNFCCRPCLNAWNSKRLHDLNLNVINVKGHNLGHLAPHLTEWNKRSNALFPVQPDPSKRGKRNGDLARKVASEKIGRPLSSEEHVHHIDGSPANNSPENLAVMNRSEHLRLHAAIARERMKEGSAVHATKR